MTTSTANETLTVSERFAKAIQEAMDADVQVHENFVGDYDCQCCANIHEYLDDVLGPVVWNSVYGNNNGYEWEGDVVYSFTLVDPMSDVDEDDEDFDPHYWSDSIREYAHKIDRISYNHSNGGAELFAEAFKNNGFDVEWDGTELQRITIVP